MLLVFDEIAFFTSCCAYLPVFEPWHKRLLYVRDNIDKLSPATRVEFFSLCPLSFFLFSSMLSPNPFFGLSRWLLQDFALWEQERHRILYVHLISH